MNLTKAQVFLLNEKHGWFAYGDAQSDVSVAFANDAIKMYNALRDDAPALLEALKNVMSRLVDRHDQDEAAIEARALIAKHGGGV